MNTKNCEKLGQCTDSRMDKINEFLNGQVTREELQVIENHLAECKECAQERDIEQIIKDALKRTCCEQAPQSLKARIKKKISSYPQI